MPARGGAINEIPPNNPVAEALNTKPKYVASQSLKDPKWSKTTVLSGDLLARVRDPKAKPGGDIQVPGSGKFARWLLENDLVDELNIFTFPLILGQGTRLFPENGPDMSLKLMKSRSMPSGVIHQVYETAGKPEYRDATMESTESR